MKSPLEHKEQVALVKKLRGLGYFVFAVPNGGKRTKLEAINLKREGVTAGIPDLQVVFQGGGVVWIELKRRKGGVVSPAQSAIHEKLRSLGHHVILGLGAKDAFQQIQEYLKPQS